ncbi:Tryptophan synthase beta subunit-like PLP-dependent enzyme [Sesbania bispinosa]|nr:Tryptophan synthase beta subunit-like PLP-dependent enzyme [Sesbania bispinosa]
MEDRNNHNTGSVYLSDPIHWPVRPVFGGKYVPETLMHALTEIEAALPFPASDEDFQSTTSVVMVKGLMVSEEGRSQPHWCSQDNNAVAQALLAKRLGKKRVIAETGAGQHGVATATALNVFRMRLLGAEVRAVHSGDCYAKGCYIRSYKGLEFQAVIGKETRRQALEKWGGKPTDVLVACVGGGSNAMGLFHEFIDDKDVRLIGVEAAGLGLESGKHAATLTKGEIGVLHGSMSYLLQDDDGQIIEPHSISAGLDYPGVGPEHSFLKDEGRAEYYSVTDEEALEAFKRYPGWKA